MADAGDEIGQQILRERQTADELFLGRPHQRGEDIGRTDLAQRAAESSATGLVSRFVRRPGESGDTSSYRADALNRQEPDVQEQRDTRRDEEEREEEIERLARPLQERVDQGTRPPPDRLTPERLTPERLTPERLTPDRLTPEPADAG